MYILIGQLIQNFASSFPQNIISSIYEEITNHVKNAVYFSSWGVHVCMCKKDLYVM